MAATEVPVDTPERNGSVPWSRSRPSSLWAFLALYVISGLYYTFVIYEGGGWVLGAVLSVVLVYFLWRGSKGAWLIAMLLTAIEAVVELGFTFTARSPGGHEPWMHAISFVFYIAMLVFLLLPPTRRFYDLEHRAREELR